MQKDLPLCLASIAKAEKTHPRERTGLIKNSLWGSGSRLSDGLGDYSVPKGNQTLERNPDCTQIVDHPPAFLRITLSVC